MVYVDQLFATPGFRKWPYKQACHMYADNLADLHQMATKIGLKRKWFQNHSRHPHYDLTANKRRLALKYGAKEKCFSGSRLTKGLNR